MLGRRVVDLPVLLVVTYRENDVTADHPLRTVLGDLATSAGSAWLALGPLSLEAIRVLAVPEGASPEELYRADWRQPVLCDGGAGRAGDRGAHHGAARRTRTRVTTDAAGPCRRRRGVGRSRPGRDVAHRRDLRSVVRRHRSLCQSWCARRRRGDVRVPARGRPTGCRGRARRGETARAARPHRRRADRSARRRSGADRPSCRRERRRSRRCPLLDERCAPGIGSDCAPRGPAARRTGARPPAHALARRGRHARGPARVLAGGVGPCRRSHHVGHRGGRRIGERRGDELKEADALTVLANALGSSGRTAAGMEAIARSIDLLESHPPGRELAAAYTRLTSSYMLARDRDTAVSWGERAIALASELGDPFLLGRALIETGIADVMDERFDGLVRINQGIELGRQHGLPALMSHGFSQIGSGCGELRRYDQAVPALIEAASHLGGAELRGQPSLRGSHGLPAAVSTRGSGTRPRSSPGMPWPARPVSPTSASSP